MRFKMSKTFSINVRVSSQQKEVIENNAKANGFTTLSDFMRTRSLCFFACEERLNKIYKKLYPEELHKKFNHANRNLFDYI